MDAAPKPESPKPARLRLNLRRHRMQGADFTRVYSEGSRAKCALLTVAVRENGTDTTRLGLSVGKRCWKGAVKRNRVRRVFREAFRHLLPELPPGLDVVLIASTPRIEPTLQSTLAELAPMVAKAHRRYRAKQEKRAAEAAGGPAQ